MAKKLRILAAADLHGDIDTARRLSSKARENKVDLVVLAGDINGVFQGNEKILAPFIEAKQKLAFIPGNWENSKETEMMRGFAKSLDKYYITCRNVGIVGVGNENWKSLDYEDLEALKENFKRMKPKKRVLVSHWHASGTLAEFSGIKGDKILRKAIEELNPDVLISAHIHEAEGIEDKIGKTRVIQVGRKGTIIEI